MARKGKKIVILGAGNVGASIAYTLTLDGMASEIVLIDINNDKAKGEAMDIIQGTAFCPPVNIYAGDYSNAKGADVVIVTVGMARKPGQTRIDLAPGQYQHNQAGHASDYRVCARRSLYCRQQSG